MWRSWRRLLSAEPLAINEPGPVEDDSEPSGVDVVVPVHGAHDETRACLASLERFTDLGRHRLVLVIDGDPSFDPGDVDLTDALVLENDVAHGFVAAVNRGMAASARDVVLLNSDTVVTAGWLEKMQRAAYSAPAIATVTPFSNNATICSLPRPLVANELPADWSVDRFAALVARVAERSYPRLPTGVGFCLYVKRRALDELGTFDEDAFGLGYGEETDFCFRALKAGWIHVLDNATFVFHHGEASFAGARAARIRNAERQLQRRHPEYIPTIAAFLDADPLRAARRRVRWALRPQLPNVQRPRRVLHVVHGWPPDNHAGTELYAHWLAHAQAKHRRVAVYTRVADSERHFGDATEEKDGGILVRRVVNNFVQREPPSRNALKSPLLERDLDAFVHRFRPDLVHVHHLAGHALSLLPRLQGLPLVYQIQDWWALCARANLWHADGTFCSGPSPGRCARCLPMTGIPPAGLWSRLLYLYRRHLARRGLRLPDAFVMGSRAVEADYRAADFLIPKDRVYVLPYGVQIPAKVAPRTDAKLPLRFGYVGSIMPHKGLHVAARAFSHLTPEQATFSLWGDPRIEPSYAESLRQAAAGVLRLEGRFAEDEKDRVFATMDVLILPSLGLESFGLVAREALAHGVPVIASRRGALVDLFPADGAGGTWVEPGDADDLRRVIDALVERPATIAEWRGRIPPVTPNAEHAAMIEHVYADVLARTKQGEETP